MEKSTINTTLEGHVYLKRYTEKSKMHRMSDRRSCMDNIAVLIPCYNEENTIEKVIEEFMENIPGAVIYVYDNNSTDSSVEKARNAGAIVRYEKKLGKGNVIRRMFREVEAEIYIMVDADDTYPAEAATALIEKIEDGADMAIGDRLNGTYFTENKRKFHNLGNRMVRYSINRLFKSDIQDIMTGYRAFSYNFVKSFPVISEGFEIETEMTIHAIDKNMRVESVPIEYRDRCTGSVSKLNTYADGAKVICTIVRMYKYYRPFVFFASIAFVLASLSILFFIPVMYSFIKTGVVEKIPTLVMCGTVMVMACLMLAIGIMLSTLKNRSLCDFEYRLMQVEQEKNRIKNGK